MLLSRAASGERLRQASRGDSRYVAVGDNGTILSSEDGALWAPQTSGITNSLRDVVWNGSIFVAVGEQGTTVTGTADGSTWTAQILEHNDLIIGQLDYPPSSAAR